MPILYLKGINMKKNTYFTCINDQIKSYTFVHNYLVNN